MHECSATQSYRCDPMDHSPPGSSVYGIFQAKILEWVAISFSRGSFQLKNLTCVSCIGRDWHVDPLALNHQGSPHFLVILKSYLKHITDIMWKYNDKAFRRHMGEYFLDLMLGKDFFNDTQKSTNHKSLKKLFGNLILNKINNICFSLSR